MTIHLDRRDFLRASAAGAAYWLSPHAARAVDVNSTLRVAAIGTGNQGGADLKRVAVSNRVAVTALCNVDHSKEHLGWAVEKYPCARGVLRLPPPARSARPVRRRDGRHARSSPTLPPARPCGAANGQARLLRKAANTIRLRIPRTLRQPAKKKKIWSSRRWGTRSSRTVSIATRSSWSTTARSASVREVHSWQSGKMKWFLSRRSRPAHRPHPERFQLELVAGRRTLAAIQEGALSPEKLASVAGFRHRSVRRLRLPHSRPSVHGPRSHVAHVHRIRQQAARKATLDAQL